MYRYVVCIAHVYILSDDYIATLDGQITTYKGCQTANIIYNDISKI